MEVNVRSVGVEVGAHFFWVDGFGWGMFWVSGGEWC